MNTVVSDEVLQAFVDGELDVAESEALMARIRDDKELAQRVCALRSLQSMVRLAYAEPPLPSGGAVAVPRRQFMQRCAFGCLILLTGLGVGWTVRGLDAPPVSASSPDAAFNGYRAVSLTSAPRTDRVLLHIDSAAPEKMKAVLDEAERYLSLAERQGAPMEVEIITNSHGLGLLREDVTPFAARIAGMKRRHASLHFVACSQTVARLTHEGKKVVLVPAAQIAPTAIGQIVHRLQQGWTYVRV